LRDALVWSGEVEIVGILLERAAQMALTQDQDVVQTLSAQAAEPAFADGVGLGCSVGSAQLFWPENPSAEESAGQAR
jgi:hypothetical protein